MGLIIIGITFLMIWAALFVEFNRREKQLHDEYERFHCRKM